MCLIFFNDSHTDELPDLDMPKLWLFLRKKPTKCVIFAFF